MRLTVQTRKVGRGRSYSPLSRIFPFVDAAARQDACHFPSSLSLMMCVLRCVVETGRLQLCVTEPERQPAGWEHHEVDNTPLLHFVRGQLRSAGGGQHCPRGAGARQRAPLARMHSKLHQPPTTSCLYLASPARCTSRFVVVYYYCCCYLFVICLCYFAVLAAEHHSPGPWELPACPWAGMKGLPLLPFAGWHLVAGRSLLMYACSTDSGSLLGSPGPLLRAASFFYFTA
jgi:hypothetical protein